MNHSTFSPSRASLAVSPGTDYKMTTLCYLVPAYLSDLLTLDPKYRPPSCLVLPSPMSLIRREELEFTTVTVRGHYPTKLTNESNQHQTGRERKSGCVRENERKSVCARPCSPVCLSQLMLTQTSEASTLLMSLILFKVCRQPQINES